LKKKLRVIQKYSIHKCRFFKLNQQEKQKGIPHVTNQMRPQACEVVSEWHHHAALSI